MVSVSLFYGTRLYLRRPFLDIFVFYLHTGNMRKYVTPALLLATLATTSVNAALLVKKNTAIYQSVSVAGTRNTRGAYFFQKITCRKANMPISATTHPRHLAELPKGVYIAMCILPLGWLAIAINSNFTENEWIFALLWYVLLYLPGVYFSLRQMKRFYGR